MDIYSIEVKTSSGSFNIGLSSSDVALQSILKDLLLKKILSERQTASGLVTRNCEPQQDVAKIPLIYWDSYTKRRINPKSNQVRVRYAVVDYFSTMVMWEFKGDVLKAVVPKFPELKEVSIRTYFDGMIAAGILERDISNREAIRLTDKFIQQKNGEVA